LAGLAGGLGAARRGDAAGRVVRGRVVRGRAGAWADVRVRAVARGAAAALGAPAVLAVAAFAAGADAAAAGFGAMCDTAGFCGRSSPRTASIIWRRWRARSSFRTRLLSSRAASVRSRSSRRSCLRRPRGIFCSAFDAGPPPAAGVMDAGDDALGSCLAFAELLEFRFAISSLFLGCASGRRAPLDPARPGSRRSIYRPCGPSIIQPSPISSSGGSSQRRTPCPGCSGRAASMRTRVALRIGSSETPASSAAIMLKSGS
jgi:hypothetical protein